MLSARRCCSHRRRRTNHIKPRKVPAPTTPDRTPSVGYLTRPELQPLRAGHAQAILALESGNRRYFAASISDRGDEYFENFAERHNALLAEQEAGLGAYYLLLAEDGSAENLPFDDQSFDAAMAVCTVHHWQDPIAGLREMQRVARRVVVFLFDTSDPNQFWLTRDYLPEVAATRGCRVLASLTALASAIGARLQPVPVPWDCADGFFEAYWRRPEAYLNENVRRGISIWASVGPDAEQRAVDSLRDDLVSGRWAERNRDLVDLDAAELGARLLIA